MSEVGELFTATADLLESDGWCAGVAQDESGRHCVLDAMAAVAEPMPYGAYREANIKLACAVYPASIVRWNDETGEPGPIIAKLRELAAAS